VLALATAGCSSGSSSTTGSEAAFTAATTDEQLAADLAKTPATFTKAQGKHLIDEAIYPVATTKRLKMLNDFILAHASSDGGEFLAGAMEGVFWGTPRDFASTPAGLGGQKLETSVDVPDTEAGPTRLRISGTARADYRLEFTIAGFPASVDRVPAGSSATDTAKLIAAVLDKSSQAIVATMEDSFKAIGGDHEDDQSGVDDLEVSTSGSTVVILVAQNGG
jgi:hypothetical protein